MERSELSKMRFALTTFDNPYDPFEQFTQWFMFDEEKGYHSCAYLGRIAKTSEQLQMKKMRKRLSVRLMKSLSMIFKTFIKKVKQ